VSANPFAGFLTALVPLTLFFLMRKQSIPSRLGYLVALLLVVCAILMTGSRGGLIVLFGAGVAFYHTGVEQHWWLGPTTCTSQGVQGLTAQQLMDQILNAPLVRCDEIPWSLFGLSMAAWNGVVSLGLAGFWVLAFRKA